jgi:hypothetical protein
MGPQQQSLKHKIQRSKKLQTYNYKWVIKMTRSMFLGLKAKKNGHPERQFLMQTMREPAWDDFCSDNNGTYRPQQEMKHCKI